MSGRRVSPERLERLERELAPRDWDVIRMLAAVRIASGAQLRRALWDDDSEATDRAARRTLLRLVHWRVVCRLERRVGGLGRGSDSWTYSLDTAGQRLLGRSGDVRRPRLPSPAMWGHVLATAEIYTRLRETVRGTESTVAQWQGEPESWRTFAGPYGETVRLKPDAFVRVEGPDYADLSFVETDTGSQSRTVIRDKARAYLRYAATGAEQAAEGVFPQVVFLTTSPTRRDVLVDVLGSLPADSWRLFRVGLIEGAAGLLTGEEDTS